MYLLDTDHCIFLLRRHEAVCREFSQLSSQPAYVSIIMVGELLFGAYRSERPEQNGAEINRFLDSIPALPLNRSSMDRFARIKAELHRRGQRLEDPDILIAATAMEHDLTLVSHNTNHYQRIDGLRLADWCR